MWNWQHNVKSATRYAILRPTENAYGESATMRTFIVRANWDAEAKVWVATSEDVPGLATEADTVEQLIEKLNLIVPELLELNGVVLNHPDEIPIELLTQKHIQLKAIKSA